MEDIFSYIISNYMRIDDHITLSCLNKKIHQNLRCKNIYFYVTSDEKYKYHFNNEQIVKYELMKKIEDNEGELRLMINLERLIVKKVNIKEIPEILVKLKYLSCI